MACNCGGGSASGAAGSAAELAPAPDVSKGKAPDGTPIGQDRSKGGTVPAYSSPGGAGVAGASGGYVAAGSQHATGLGASIAAPNRSVDPSVGGLSKKYESTGDYGAFGNNPGDKGGPSYGAYQIATGPGTMNNFLNQLQKTDPAAYANLMNAGGPQAAAAGDPTFVAAWKNEAATNPQFAADQDGFIQATHYDPAVAKVLSATGVDINAQPLGVQQAFYSWAVHAGPTGAANGMIAAIQGKNASAMSGNDFVNTIYDARTANIQGNVYASSITNRFVNERQDALASNLKSAATKNVATITNGQTGV